MLLRTTPTGQRTSAPRRGGFVIVAVLMVVTVLSLAAYQYSALMDAEIVAAERIRKTTEARAAADSGLHYAMAYVSDTTAYQGVLNSNPFNNPVFQSVVVADGETARSQSRFALMSLDYSQAATSGAVPLKFGLTDEAGKLNVNALFALDTSGKVLHDALMKLPNMTDDIAWSIVDWIDPDDVENSGGAEDTYYTQLPTPYHCKNGPLDSIEELLLVKGVTPTLLFGTDRNRNGRADPGEDDGTGFSVGWAAYLTVYSREPNVDSTGKPRINLNGNDLTQLNTDLTNAVGAEMAAFIIGYRLFGTGSSSNAAATVKMGNDGGLSVTIQSGGPPGTISQLQTKVQEALTASTPPQARQRISSLFSLINAKVAMPMDSGGKGGNGKGGSGKGGSSQQTLQVPSPLANKDQQVDLMGKLLDLTTTQQGTELPARVNVNTAPREVLMTLPGMTDATADLMVAKRPSYLNGQAPDSTFATVAWLLQDDAVPVNTLQGLERYITARTQVYRVQSIGYFAESGPIARVEAVIDANQGKPRLVYYRDLTEMGRAIDPRTAGQ